jgi:hypothetical protein
MISCGLVFLNSETTALLVLININIGNDYLLGCDAIHLVNYRLLEESASSTTEVEE